ncbi:unnamed protein product, partial [Tetraodon nigroviridis]
VDRRAFLCSSSISKLRSKPPGDLQGPPGPTYATSYPYGSQTYVVSFFFYLFVLWKQQLDWIFEC